MNDHLISVIIPVYNTEKYLAQAIESVLRQSLQADEILVVDDGSTDKSKDVAQQFKSNVSVFNLEKNTGCAAARNFGIKQASGNYIAFLDADDLWTPDKLKNQHSFLVKNPETEMVFGMVEQFISPELPDEHKSKLRAELQRMAAFVAGGMLISKQNFLKAGLFNEKLEVGEFIDWFSRAKDIGLSYHVENEVVLKRRIHTTNMGLSKKQHLKDYTALLREALARKRNLKQD